FGRPTEWRAAKGPITLCLGPRLRANRFNAIGRVKAAPDAGAAGGAGQVRRAGTAVKTGARSDGGPPPRTSDPIGIATSTPPRAFTRGPCMDREVCFDYGPSGMLSMMRS